MNLLGKPTDADLLTFPHVLLTGPHEWDQSVIDYTHPTTNVLMMTPRKSTTDLLLDLQILPIPTRDWYQMEGRAPRPQTQGLCQV